MYKPKTLGRTLKLPLKGLKYKFVSSDFGPTLFPRLAAKSLRRMPEREPQSALRWAAV